MRKTRREQFIWMDEEETEQEKLRELVQPSSPPVARQRKAKTNKMEFVGWGSRQLFDFLESIGMDTANKLDQHAVTDIIYKYISENNLINPSKKKRVNCDVKLQALFGRRTVGRIKISDLLEKHLAENQVITSDDSEEVFNSSEDDASVTPKRRAVSSAEKRAPKKTKQAPVSNDSCFAEVVPENIRLVYLRKSLVQELIKDVDTFEDKVIGCFVRIKSDPIDYTQKNPFMLVQVTGIKKLSVAGDVERQFRLHVSNSFKDITISMLSDDDLTKEECDDIKRRIRDGLLGRLIVADLEKKAQVIHQDITGHWIKRELIVLQKQIDRANEKGWRRELSAYLDRQKLLQMPSEQSRLLQEPPKVIAEKIVPEPTNEPSPEPVEKMSTGPAEYYSSDDGDDWLDSLLKAAQDARAQASADNGTTATASPADTTPGAENQEQNTSAKGKDGEELLAKCSENEALQGAMHNLAVEVKEEATCVELVAENPKSEASIYCDITDVKEAETDPACIANISGENPKSGSGTRLAKPVPEVIELSDDDEEECASSLVCQNPESAIWNYMDPQGEKQGPFPLILLKVWHEADYFKEVKDGFMIWKTGEPNAKILLAEIIDQTFSKHQR